MKYLLTSLNHTDTRALAIKNYIQMGFNIDPREVRYDKLPSINKSVNETNEGDRNLVVRERLTVLIERIQKTLGTKIQIENIEQSNSETTITLKVQEELLKFKL